RAGAGDPRAGPGPVGSRLAPSRELLITSARQRSGSRRHRSWWQRVGSRWPPRRGQLSLDEVPTDCSRLAIADFLLAAWFLWMTPLLTALSSLREASRASVVANSRSPDSSAAWNLRIAVFNDDLTDLFRSRRFSFCRMRLICDLMFATRQPRPDRVGPGCAGAVRVRPACN